MLEKARMRREKLDSELAAFGDTKRSRKALVENNPSTITVNGKHLVTYC
jgi:hypothetical protein